MLKNIVAQYKKLKTREKALAILITMVIAASLYHRILYKPLTKDAATYAFQAQKLNSRLEELMAQYPKLDEQKENIRLAEAVSKEISEKIVEVDSKIPAGGDASRLISQITRQASEFELSSVQQKMDDGDLYSRIYIELEFNSSYEQAVGFISKVERISPFLKVEEMSISEPTAKSKNRGLAVSLLLSCLLREGDEVVWASEAAEEGPEQTLEVRNIFASPAKPVVVDKKKKSDMADLKLEGITYTPWSPTAIINDDVVKVGMRVDGYEVKEITPDIVILTDGIEDITLTMER